VRLGVGVVEQCQPVTVLHDVEDWLKNTIPLRASKFDHSARAASVRYCDSVRTMAKAVAQCAG
jgi:hypothetical protein